MKHAGLFSGIGGFSLAAEWMGWQNVFEVEKDGAKRAYLHDNFPLTQLYDDVRSFPASEYANAIDVLTGGFPCQDISQAGRGAGLEGKKSSLWFAFLSAICRIRPRYVVIENSSMLLVRGLETVLAGLAQAGYDAKWAVVPASRYGAPMRRERLYLLAYSNGIGWAQIPNWPECLTQDCWHPGREEPARWDTPAQAGYEAWMPALAKLRRMDDGIPIELAAQEFHAYGDAIVPHCALEIFRALEAADLTPSPYN